jgi:hypothetical protein
MQYKTVALCVDCGKRVKTWRDTWWSCDACGAVDRELENPNYLDSIWIQFCRCPITSIIRRGRLGHDVQCILYDKPVGVKVDDDD